MYSQVNKVNAYKKIAFNFLFLVLILIGFIAYFIFYKVEIVVEPVKESVSVEFIVEVQDRDDEVKKGSGFIKGAVNETEIEGEKEFEATGTKEVFASFAGKVFIVNKESFNQPLIATTRLLTPDNILFRIKSGVTVPAGGEVEVDIYPDDETFGEIVKPTKLTIPGLSKSRQETIYAENRADIGTTKEINILSQEDLNIAKEILVEELYDQAKEQFNLTNKNKVNFNFIGKIPKIKNVGWKNIVSDSVNKEIGEETDKFTLSLKIRAVEISFNENDTKSLAEENILDSVPDDKEFIEIDRNSFSYIIDDFDSDQKIARLKVYATGEMIIGERSRILDKTQFIGMLRSEVENQIKSSPAIENVRIKSPFNLLKFIPKNEDKIKIRIIGD